MTNNEDHNNKWQSLETAIMSKSKEVLKGKTTRRKKSRMTEEIFQLMKNRRFQNYNVKINIDKEVRK